MKNFGIWSLLVLSFGPTAILLLFSFSNPSDQQIAYSAPEDILGFGFAFTWLVLAVPEFLLLGIPWTNTANRTHKVVCVVSLVLFVVVSAFAYAHYRQLKQRVFSKNAASRPRPVDQRSAAQLVFAADAVPFVGTALPRLVRRKILASSLRRVEAPRR